MAIILTFPCPECGGRQVRRSRSGSPVTQLLARAVFMKMVRCLECHLRFCVPNFLPEQFEPEWAEYDWNETDLSTHGAGALIDESTGCLADQQSAATYSD